MTAVRVDHQILKIYSVQVSTVTQSKEFKGLHTNGVDTPTIHCPVKHYLIGEAIKQSRSHSSLMSSTLQQAVSFHETIRLNA